MRYLITGGAGFIGSHMAEYILNRNEGHHVVILDDFSTGTQDNLLTFKNSVNCTVIKDSVLNLQTLDEIVDDVDYIFHFASAVGVKYILSNQLKSLDTAILGSRNIFSIATKKHKKVMFSSSSEVYGKSISGVYTEDEDKVIGSTEVFRWSYSVAKNLSEYYLHAFESQGLEYDIVRFFNVVGPRQSSQYGMVLPTFVRQALCGEDITIYGSGNQIRCFTYVKDVCDICYQLSMLTQKRNSTYNVGSNIPISIDALADLVIKTTKSHSKKTYQSYEDVFGPRFEDCHRRIPNIDRILDELGTYSFTSIEEIVYQVVQHERTKHNSISKR